MQKNNSVLFFYIHRQTDKTTDRFTRSDEKLLRFTKD